jgi:predicted signal transduction protein with EAL and GGDEF domain
LRLKGKLRSHDMIARLGGDEFVVVLDDVSETKHLSKIVEAIISNVEQPIIINNINAEVNISTSIGISLYPEHGDNALDLIRYADVALYQAKTRGRGSVNYYSETLSQQARKRFQMEASLREAIAKNYLTLYYQPKICVSTGEVIGAEALVRWLDPDLGIIMPNEFIGIAEETGIIIQLGEWVLNKACEQTKIWLDQGLDLIIAVNLSANQLYHSNITECVQNALTNSGLPGKYLELELTESILMRNVSESIKKLSIIKELGVSIAIDDFGTGYSSLSYLRKFPLNTLKIDRLFIADLEQSNEDQKLTAMIINIAKSLNLNSVAEGVENAYQLEFLQAHGCTSYQGFYVSPAIPADEFIKFIHQKK